MQKIILSVTSDLVTDQRVHRMAQTLHNFGYEVVVFGRKKRSSKELALRDYKIKRTQLLFDKGFLFYAFYNIRLFLFLLFSKADILLANDLDTLFPNFLIAKWLKRKLIYDTHEYFTGVPELLERPFVKNIWKRIENYIFPKLKTVYTVNQSIANLYTKEYNVHVNVIRNLPLPTVETNPPIENETFSLIPARYSETAIILNLIYEALQLDSRKIVLYQGAINKDRGIEEMIAAMEFIQDASFVIIGNGDLYKSLKNKVKSLHYGNKIIMIGQVAMEFLPAFTKLATIGISIEKPTNINYIYSSPNKVVDYIQAGVPVLASRLVEIEHIISQYNIGSYIENHQPQHIAEILNKLLADSEKLKEWKANCKKASKELNWGVEEQKLLGIILD